MYTKLTLRLEKEIIEKIKIFAMTKKQSLSNLTEYLYKKTLESEIPQNNELSPIVKKYKGIIKSKNFNERDEISDYLSEKHR